MFPENGKKLPMPKRKTLWITGFFISFGLAWVLTDILTFGPIASFCRKVGIETAMICLLLENWLFVFVLIFLVIEIVWATLIKLGFEGVFKRVKKTVKEWFREFGK
jgi:hypothetical protein